uniref:Malic enzyme NAD-binding domain-containing protein n=1 Tax=Peronospora matthiolae TaxID=2874970 RepID=A0AAV1VE79_9STRA
MSEQRAVFVGAGTAGRGIADLTSLAIARETGKTMEESRKQIWLVDSLGLVVQSRIDVESHTMPQPFDKDVCRKIGEINRRPIIFALSNPTSKSECTAKEAYTFTDGKCMFASGSPFDPVEIDGKLCVPGQGNDSYIFPGVGLGVVAAGLTHVDDEIMIIAAKHTSQSAFYNNILHDVVYLLLLQGFKRGDTTVSKPENMTHYLQDFMHKP